MDASSAPCCSHKRQHHMVTNGVTNAVPATAWRLAVVIALLSAAPVSDVEATGVPTTLRVELTDLSGLTPRVVAGLRKEVEQLWATQYRVDWTERSLQCVNPITESPLFVTVLAGPITGIRKDVIATIRFVDGTADQSRPRLRVARTGVRGQMAGVFARVRPMAARRASGRPRPCHRPGAGARNRPFRPALDRARPEGPDEGAPRGACARRVAARRFRAGRSVIRPPRDHDRCRGFLSINVAAGLRAQAAEIRRLRIRVCVRHRDAGS